MTPSFWFGGFTDSWLSVSTVQDPKLVACCALLLDLWIWCCDLGFSCRSCISWLQVGSHVIWRTPIPRTARPAALKANRWIGWIFFRFFGHWHHCLFKHRNILHILFCALVLWCVVMTEFSSVFLPFLLHQHGSHNAINALFKYAKYVSIALSWLSTVIICVCDNLQFLWFKGFNSFDSMFMHFYPPLSFWWWWISGRECCSCSAFGVYHGTYIANQCPGWWTGLMLWSCFGCGSS